MLKTRIVSALCASLLLAASGAEIDLSGYLPPAAGDRGGSLVRNAGFEQGAAGWENIDGTECSTGSYGIQPDRRASLPPSGPRRLPAGVAADQDRSRQALPFRRDGPHQGRHRRRRRNLH